MTSCYGDISLRVVLVIFGGFLVHLALGAMYTIGNFSPYIVSYIRNRTDDTSIRNVDSLWIISIGSIGQCIGLSIGGLNAHRFGARIATLIGSVIFCTATAMNYFSVKSSFIVFVITYGLIRYLGHKATYGTPVQTAIKWLPNHATLAAGLVVSGTGGGSMIFNQIITEYVNPNNLSPDYIDDDDERYFTQEEVLDKVPSCFLILGGIYFGLQILGIVCLAEPPSISKQVQVKAKTADIDYETNDDTLDKEKHDLNKVGVSSNDQIDSIVINSAKQSENIDRNSEPQKQLGILEAVKVSLTSRSFYILWLTILLISCGMQFISGLYKAYGQTFIDDDHFLAVVGSVSAVFNCLGRPIWGAVMDKVGYRITMWIISGGFAITTGTLLFTEHFHKSLFLVWVCAIFFFFCGIWSMIPSALAKLLGPEHMAINYGMIYTGVSIAAILGSTLASTLKSEIGWHGLFFLSSGMGVIVFIVSFFFNGVDRSGKNI
ncbi:hypothetical protein ACF0H5_020255 [Mactra antiquata]